MENDTLQATTAAKQIQCTPGTLPSSLTSCPSFYEINNHQDNYA